MMNMIQKTSRQPTMNYDELLISNQGGGVPPKSTNFFKQIVYKGGRDTPLADKTRRTVFDRLPIVINQQILVLGIEHNCKGLVKTTKWGVHPVLPKVGLVWFSCKYINNKTDPEQFTLEYIFSFGLAFSLGSILPTRLRRPCVLL